eukprot:3411250-Alexandrium_andersonii.AAC.1
MGSHGQQPGRSWIPATARSAGGTDPVDTAGDLRRSRAPDGAGGCVHTPAVSVTGRLPRSGP